MLLLLLLLLPLLGLLQGHLAADSAAVEIAGSRRAALKAELLCLMLLRYLVPETEEAPAGCCPDRLIGTGCS